MNTKLFSLIFLLSALLVVEMFGIWHMDVAMGAELSKGYLTNGWINFDRVQVFHAGLYLVMGSSFVLASLAAYGISLHDGNRN